MSIVKAKTGLIYIDTVFSWRPFILYIKIFPYDNKNGIENVPIYTRIGTSWV